jgi:16S rRNA (guanine527-N7)-methyltransferase
MQPDSPPSGDPRCERPPFEPPASDTLAAALARHGIELAADRAAQLDRYCRLLWDWNAKLNLTRHTDHEKFVARDLVDTLVISRHLEKGDRVLDVGTGGGVPGVVLAIVRPDFKVALSESVGKKARAVEAIVSELGLKTPVHHCRAEDVFARHAFDALTVRAVAPLAKLLTWFAPHWQSFERLLVIKGPAWVEERRAARELGLFRKLQLRKLETWPLPGTESESVLLEIRRKEQAAPE